MDKLTDKRSGCSPLKMEGDLKLKAKSIREGAEKKKRKTNDGISIIEVLTPPPPVIDGKYKVILFGIRTML